jgi:hypothetical protein
MAALDRLKQYILGVARAANPASDYQRLARAKFLKQQSARRVEVQPADKDLPPMASVPVKYGVPGLEVTGLPPGAQVMAGFEDGRPDRPFVCFWNPGTEGRPVKITWHAQFIELGGPCVPIKDGVLNGETVEPITGLPFWMLGGSSLRVMAKKA